MRARERGAFTLLEVLAVVLLTSIVIGVALDHYVNLSRASTRAMGATRDVRRATAVLDRVARDLENTLLLSKKDDQDPLEHPWLFLGESHRSELGADHLKFVSRGRRARGQSGHGSDLEVVVYALRRNQDDDLELMRWSSPRLPEGLDRELPSEEEEGAQLLSDDIAAFGVTFIDEAGETSTTWDSSQIEDSGELPAAADIEVAMLDPLAVEDAEPRVYRRRVVLPVRPLDPVEIFDPVSLVSGGSGTAEELAGDDAGDDAGADPEKLQECLSSSPCANMTACQAIGCKEKMGRLGDSIDLLLEQTMQSNLAFCQWQHVLSPSLRWLIDDTACR